MPSVSRYRFRLTSRYGLALAFRVLDGRALAQDLGKEWRGAAALDLGHGFRRAYGHHFPAPLAR